ncbi:Integrator complex subunit 7 [Borealophlyctis nickersoniae]|nr:Integrator complex subunit 7 [Borealophlyctis nickersoniae]
MLRRLFEVLTSNDPVARSLTLRLLGYMSPMVHDRFEVHHSIRQYLDSKETMELEAAIFAAGRVSIKSPVFAAGICDTIAEMIDDQYREPAIRARLVRLFRHMHHGFELPEKARSICRGFLERDRTVENVLNTLRTLTYLSKRAVFLVPSHVDLLTKFIAEDPRDVIRHRALCDLRILAKVGSLRFSEGSVLTVLDVACDEPSRLLRRDALFVVESLWDNPYLSFKLGKQDPVYMRSKIGSYIDRLRSIVMSSSDACVTTAASMIVKLMHLASECNLDVQAYDSLLGLGDSVVERIVSQGRHDRLSKCEHLLRVFLTLSPLLPEQRVLGYCGQLFHHPIVGKGAINLFLGSDTFIAQLLKRNLLAVVELLRNQGKTLDVSIVMRIGTFLIRSSVESDEQLRHTIEASLKLVLDRLTVSADGNWRMYCLAREAFCSGYNVVAEEVFRDLASKVEAERINCWLKMLAVLASGESHIQMARSMFGKESSQKSTACLLEAHSISKGLTSKGSFQTGFIRLRLDFYKAIQDLLQYETFLRHMSSNAPLKGFKKRVPIICYKLAYMSNRLLHNGPSDDIMPPQLRHYLVILRKGSETSSKSWSQAQKLVMDALRGMPTDDDPAFFQRGWEWIGSLVTRRIPMPRYLFITRSSVSVELSVDPRWKDNFRIIKNGEQMVLTFEGMVHLPGNWATRGYGRVIQQAELAIKLTPADLQAPLPNGVFGITQPFRTTVQDGYFSRLCLITFPNKDETGVSYCHVNVDCRLVDAVGTVWYTGPTLQLGVKLD